jgi:twitching motility protein PilI
VDLADFIADCGGGTRSTAAGIEASVVTLNPLLEVNCAVRVDVLSGLRGSDAFASSTPPERGAPSYFGNRFVDSAGITWQEINLRLLAQSPQFLSISA